MCTNLSTDAAVNQERLANGNPYNRHFRAYNADFRTTRRCCTGVSRDCASCFDTWEHFSWIMINMKQHLGSQEDFTGWLGTMYVFYLVIRLVEHDERAFDRLGEIQQRLRPFAANSSRLPNRLSA